MKEMVFSIIHLYVKKYKLYNQDPKIACNIQANTIKWKNLILEKFREKYHQIRSSYDGEIPITIFNSRLKS